MNEEFIPIEINLEKVRRSRELGVLRLGQPMKSFRDRPVEFDVYTPGLKHPHLEGLGPLIKPKRVQELGELEIKDETRAHELPKHIITSFRPPSEPTSKCRKGEEKGPPPTPPWEAQSAAASTTHA
ncbi:MAG: hypothetical protein IPG92_00205 [Flavobacteriales bacterium]|nr:hypothetical protein [Flavobacteriales bacterium]